MNKIHQYVVILICLFAIVFFCAWLFGGQVNNPLTATLFVASLLLGIGCVVSLRFGFVVFLVSAAYSDCLKRLLVFYSYPSLIDISVVLALPPLLLGCCTLHIFFLSILKRMELSRALILLYSVIFFFNFVVFAWVFLRGEGGARSVQFVLNGASYALLLPMMVVMIRDNLFTIQQVLKVFLIIFFPVVAYGIVQKFRGFADFEIMFMEGGATITHSLLLESIVRPFSTTSSPLALALTCVFYAVACIAYNVRSQVISGSVSIGAMLALLLAVTCLFLTYVRTGWVTMIISVCFIVCFRKRISTIAIYSLAIISASLLIGFSPFLLEGQRFRALTEGLITAISDDPHVVMALRLSTAEVRLIGFKNMMENPDMWTPFGVLGADISDYGSAFFTHDALSGFLLTFGYVPLAITCVAVVSCVTAIHSRIGRVHPKVEFLSAVCMLSYFAAAFTTNLASRFGANLLAFPANVMFYLSLALVVAILYNYGGKQVLSSSDNVEEGAS